MRQKGFTPVIIFFIVIAVVALGSAVSKTLAKRAQPQPSTLPKPTLSAEEKTLKNWSSSVSGNIVTFTDGESKYFFTVPAGWETQPVCNGGVKDDKYICIKSPDLVQNAIPVVEKGQLIAIAPPGSSYFVNGFTQDPNNFCVEDPMSKYLSCKTDEINGQKVIKKIFANYSFIDVAILKDDKINLTIRLEYPSPPGYKGSDFDKFLSTLKYSQSVPK